MFATVVIILVSALLGLCIGSFLNVVIHRLPLMLEAQWQKDAHDTLQQPYTTPPSFNLATPRSRCPHCQAPIYAKHNIPLLSYFLLKGKCAACQQPISIQYPLIELITTLFTLFVVWQFGISWQCLYALMLTWSLIALAAIDWRVKLLPDQIVLPLLWLGLLINCFGVFTTPIDAIFGAALGYSVLWLIATAFLKLRKKEGMGYGDFKLLAMLGAWFGTYALLNIVLIAAITALIIMSIATFLKKHQAQHTFAFGPYLAIAGWLTLMYGNVIVNRIVGS